MGFYKEPTPSQQPPKVDEPSPGDWLDYTTHITKDGIHFGDHKVPGLIVENGIVIKPSANDVNTITVTFLVGRVDVATSLD